MGEENFLVFKHKLFDVFSITPGYFDILLCTVA